MKKGGKAERGENETLRIYPVVYVNQINAKCFLNCEEEFKFFSKFFSFINLGYCVKYIDCRQTKFYLLIFSQSVLTLFFSYIIYL